MLVAGAGRVEEDDPGYVALVLGGVGGGVAQTAEGCLVAAVHDDRLEDVGIDLVEDAEEVTLPLGAGVQGVAHAGDGAGVGVLEELLGHVDETVDDLLAVLGGLGLEHLVQDDREGLALGCVGNFALHIATSF